MVLAGRAASAPSLELGDRATNVSGISHRSIVLGFGSFASPKAKADQRAWRRRVRRTLPEGGSGSQLLSRDRSAGSLFAQESLARGASRHLKPSPPAPLTSSSRSDSFQIVSSPRSSAAADAYTRLFDHETAEAYGRMLLGSDSWIERMFRFADGDDSLSLGYLLPAEFAMLINRLHAWLGDVPANKGFRLNFASADRDHDGRIGAEEWEEFAHDMVHVFGLRRCKRAAMKVLGAAKAEVRRLKDHIWMFDGFRLEASRRLFRACVKWNMPSALENIKLALEQNADPNCAMDNKQYNGYTPLIFLSMAQPTSAESGEHVAQGIHMLLAARADIHRANDEMPFGKWVPLRFAAQMQNTYGVDALLEHIDVGDRFSWAAGEAVEHVMLAQIRRKCGEDAARRVESRAHYSMHATVLLQVFASSIVGGSLTADGAQKLLDGKYKSEGLPPNARADPNGAGLEGQTALMDVTAKGNLACVRVLLAGRASPLQRNANGATPLHLASAHLLPGIAKLLLEARAEPHAVDDAGFTPMMLVGESIADETGEDEKSRAQEIIDLLSSNSMTPEEIVDQIDEETWEEAWADELNAKDANEALQARLRLHESLFYNHGVVRVFGHEARSSRDWLVARVSDFMIGLLLTDPLKGRKKVLAKYLLQATAGPRAGVSCGHVTHPWTQEDNRVNYRDKLREAVLQMLGKFEAECFEMRDIILERKESDPAGPCAQLRAVPADVVTVPEQWQSRDRFWQKVQERQVLRFDPPWARQIHDGATACLGLMRLGTISTLADYANLQQVNHAPMEEMLARGYVTYSNVCNEPFQTRMKEIAARAAARHGIDVRPPEGIVGAKRLKRLMEKTREARVERGGLDWPGRRKEYLGISYCFHILDTVRLSFTCCGETLEEQVDCCMKLLNEFRSCTYEADGVQVLRQKSGFAEGVEATGGYADVKLLIFADLGSVRSFDDTPLKRQIVGEVQLILQGYAAVKARMHLAYEVRRGSFGPW